MTADDTSPATDRSPQHVRRELAVRLAMSVVASMAWTAIVLVRVQTLAPSVIVGALGSCALTVGLAVMLTRWAFPLSETARTLILGALASSGIVAVLGRLLRAHTHHRALGGVTFALTSVLMVLGGAAVVRRLRQLARAEGIVAGIARLAPWLIASVSFAPAARSALVSGMLQVHPDQLRDGLAGAAALAIALAAPRAWVGERRSRIGVAVWLLAVVSGIAVVARDADVRALLRARAPIALGLSTLADP